MTFIEPLSPFDCIVLNKKIEETGDIQVPNEALFCETLDMIIDLKKMQVKWTKYTKEKLFITPSQNNDRMKPSSYQAYRP